MASSAKKARKDEGSLGDVVVIFYAPQKLVACQVEGMRRAMTRMGYETVKTFQSRVTHIVSGFTFEEEVWENLKINPVLGVNIISQKWHADSIRAKVLLPVQEYQLKSRKSLPVPVEKVHEESQEESKSDYSCQRRTPLKHHNSVFTEALELLSLQADLAGGDTNYSRSLAFMRCSAVLKSLPYKVTSISQVKKKKDVGDHCLEIIKDILDFGSSREVDALMDGEWFPAMKLFTNVFGVGSATANDWFSRGHRSLEDVLNDPRIASSNDPRLSIGLAYYSDLAMKVSLKEAESWKSFIHNELKRLDKDVTVDITGGFRRGKQFGHDIDLLISHPRDGAEEGILTKLLHSLTSRDLILYGRYEKSSFTEFKLKDDTKHTPLKSSLDHFEKWIGVVKMNRGILKDVEESSSNDGYIPEDFIPLSLKSSEAKNRKALRVSNVTEACQMAEVERDWVARRVDLIVTPQSQYYYALVGWTGSKEFNRSLRWYAQRELNYKLTSHGIWDLKEKRSIPAESEKDVFDKLKLPYFLPQERNC